MHLPPIPRFLARWTIRFTLIAVFVGLPGLLLYLREFGIGFGLKERIAEALSNPAITTSIEKISFDPFQGLIAQKVEVNEKSGEQRNLAKVERLVVSINLNDLMARKISIDLIELDETDISVPLNSRPKAPRINLKGVTAQCLFIGEQLRISSFEANVQGVRVVLSGLLQNPSSFKPGQPGSPSKDEPHREVATDILDQLAELKFPGAAPELRAEVSGDLSDLTTLQVVPITFRSGPIVAPKWRIEGVEMDATYEGKELSVDRLVIYGKGGAVTASAHLKDQAVDFEISGGMFLESFLKLAPKNSPLHQLKFSEAPQFNAFGKVHFGESPLRYHVTGASRFGKFSFKGVHFDSFAADFAVRDGNIYARDIKLTREGGEVVADVLVVPGDFRLHLTNTIAPTVFAPLMGEKEQEFLKMMEFRDPPYLQIDVQGAKPDFASIKGSGSIQLGRTAMRGSWIDWAKSQIEFKDRAVYYKNLQLGRGKGLGTGTFIYDFGRQEVRLENIVSTLPPVEVLMWADPKIAAVVRDYRFNAPPHVLADGMVHMKDPKQNNLALKIKSEEGLDYDLLNRTLKFGRTQADVNIKGSKVYADVKSAKLMGGDVGLKAIVSIDASDPTLDAEVDIRRVNFAKLTKLYFDYDDSLGVGSGRYKFTSRLGQEEKMQGVGHLKVEDGHVFAIPILGPLSEIINKIIPGAGFQTARLATADFTVANETITTKNLSIDGAGFSLIGSGDIFYTKDKMDMSVRINARGLPGIVLFPVSKLLEYVSVGSASKPEWRPKMIPRFGGNGAGEQ